NFTLALYDGKTGALLSLMQADYLGQVRTGAASGVATQLMARMDATEVGIFGSGKQARTQLQAVCKVRKISHVSVYSPNEERRRNPIVVDSKEQARLEAGDFVQPLEEGSIHWANIHELGQLIVGRYTGRADPADVTLFKSLGIAVEDIAVAARVHAKAKEAGVGKMLEW